MDIVKLIGEAAESCIENKNIFLVDVNVKGNAGHQKVLVFIDGDESFGIDECSAISHRLGDILEEKQWITENYTIEVSSPGVDKPLKFPRQYPKHIGRDLEVVMKDKAKLVGRLAGVDAENIIIIPAGGKQKKNEKDAQVKLAFSEIEKAKVLVRL
ncbi:MAG: ribosome maturation factor RimP [Cyclobacteriaceae bacterium]|nr:ribosome maturation factor RimP [Cyclobacteriaceae bacterium]